MFQFLQTLTQYIGAAAGKVESRRLFDEAKALFDAGEFKQALPVMKEAAEKGSPFAMAHLAVMCLKGLGADCNWKRAAELYEMTLKLENYQGIYFTSTAIKSHLGLIYGIGGYGLKRDTEKAKAYLKEAADEGDARAGDTLKLVTQRKGVFGQKERAKPEIKW
jgi:tetratricopeptide (TPR) repeat protein